MSNAKSIFHRRTIERTKMSNGQIYLRYSFIPIYVKSQSWWSHLQDYTQNVSTVTKAENQSIISLSHYSKGFLLAKWLVLLDTTYLNLSESFCSSSLCLFVVDVFFFFEILSTLSLNCHLYSVDTLWNKYMHIGLEIIFSHFRNKPKRSLRLLWKDLNVTGKTCWPCGFGHEGSRKRHFLGRILFRIRSNSHCHIKLQNTL